MGSRINSLKHVTRQGWVFVFISEKKKKKGKSCFLMTLEFRQEVTNLRK